MVLQSGARTAGIICGSGASKELRLISRVASNPLIQAFSDCSFSTADRDGVDVDSIKSSYFLAFSSKSRIYSSRFALERR
jgi:hypothetical protein